jgi:hypothetical protein
MNRQGSPAGRQMKYQFRNGKSLTDTHSQS